MGEGPEPVCKASGLLDDQVDGFGAAVGDAVGLEVGQDLGPPGAQGAAEACDFGDRAGVQGRDQLGGDLRAGRRGGLVVDRAQPLVAAPGDGHFPVRVADVQSRLEDALAAGDPDWEVTVAWGCYQRLRSIYHQRTAAAGTKVAAELIATLYTCPIPEVARLGRTLRAWRAQVLAYFETDGVSNGGTEAINLIIEKTRRLAHGFRTFTHYRLCEYRGWLVWDRLAGSGSAASSRV